MSFADVVSIERCGIELAVIVAGERVKCRFLAAPDCHRGETMFLSLVTCRHSPTKWNTPQSTLTEAARLLVDVAKHDSSKASMSTCR